jgi:hypothetical protein
LIALGLLVEGAAANHDERQLLITDWSKWHVYSICETDKHWEEVIIMENKTEATKPWKNIAGKH